MKQDKSNKIHIQKLERDTRAGIREKLLALPHHHKLNLGLLAREPSVPSTVEYVNQYLLLFADNFVRDMHNNADTRMAALERLMPLHISLMHITTEEGMHREIISKLERVPFNRLLETGVFGTGTTPEMAEENLQELEDIHYHEMMEEGSGVK